jgi:transposase-like protein
LLLLWRIVLSITAPWDCVGLGRAVACRLHHGGERGRRLCEQLDRAAAVVADLARRVGDAQEARGAEDGGRAVGELDEAAELRRLRKENAQLLLENDILKKAAVILGTHAQPQSKLAR